MSVTYDPIFEQGEKLSKEQVARELVKRIPIGELNTLRQVLGGSNSNQGAQVQTSAQVVEVFLTMLDSVDPKYLTREFAENADIRPLLADYYANAPEEEEQKKAIAITLIPTMTDIITAAAEEVWPDEQLDEDDKATKDAMINAWRGGEVKSLNLTPTTTTDVQTGEMSINAPAGSIAEGMFAPDLGDGEGVNSHRFISEADWRRMLRQGSDDFDSLLVQDELMRQGEGNAYIGQDGSRVQINNLGVQFDDTTRPLETKTNWLGQETGPGTIPEHIRNPRLEQNWYGLSQIMQKPYELTREEALELHNKMKKAGIYDMAGGEPTIPGDISDPAFTRAWKHLATKSMSENKSMMSILEEQTAAYDAALNAQLATQLTDPARVRMNANAMARSAIGRHLSEEEQAELTQFVHELERKNARIAAGLEETSNPDVDYSDVEGQTEGTLYDIDAQIDQWFERNLPDQTGAYDMAQSYEMFTSMLGGPGRGVS